MTEKLRILHLITDLGKGGAERYLLDLCNELKKRGDVEFHIASLLPNNEYATLSADLPVSFLNYQPHTILGNNEQLEYKNLLDRFKPDIVHTHRFLAEFLSSFHVSPKITYVCHGHDNMIQFSKPSIPSFLNRNKLTNLYEKKLIIRRKFSKAACYFIANSKHTYEYFVSVLPKQQQTNVRLIEYGFNYNKFRNPAEIKLPGSGKEIRLINVGSFQDKKNQVFLVRVAHLLKLRGIPFHLEFLGSGKNFEKIKTLIGNLGLQQEISLSGNVDKVEERLRKSHLYVHAATYEPFGLVFLEAMASGLPCISLDGQGNRDLIIQNKNGILLTNEDPEIFSDEIIRIANNSMIYKEMSAFGKVFAAQYDIATKTEELVTFYKEISTNESGN